MGEDNVISYNVIINPGGNGISNQKTGLGGDIYNNTIYGANDGISVGNANTGTNVKNNIIVNSVDDGLTINAGATNYTHQYNLIYNSGGTDWDGAATQQSNDVNADPLFVDAASDNFNLLPLSPARNAGTPQGSTPYSSATADMNGFTVTCASGKARYGGRLDMGAYEFLEDGGIMFFNQ